MKMNKCISCGSDNTVSFLQLGETEWGNRILTKEELPTLKKYILDYDYCIDCKLVFLVGESPSEEAMFSKHTYLSGASKSLVSFFDELAKENICQFKLNEHSVIGEFGSNDGSQLRTYVDRIGFRSDVFGIESATNIAKIAEDENGIKTYNDFFSTKWVDNYLSGGGEKCDLFLSSGSFFHNKNINGLAKAVYNILKDDGVFVCSFGDLTSVLNNKSVDYFYCEHYVIYNYCSIEKLLYNNGLIIIDSIRNSIHNGSIIIKAVKKESMYVKFETKRCAELAMEEYDIYDNNLDIYSDEDIPFKISEFKNDIENNRFKLRKLLVSLKEKGNKIYGMSAPVKATTLLAWENIDSTLLDKLVEVNKLKIGKYHASGIYIDKESKDDIPDYYLILAHNFSKEIIKNNIDIIKLGVKFIIPVPEIKVIGENNIEEYLNET